MVTPSDPAILLLIPVTLLLMVALAWPLENTQTGRDLMDYLERRIRR